MYTRYNCKTWHPAYPSLNHREPIDHFEMSWDDDGKPTITGNRQMISIGKSEELWRAAQSVPPMR